MLILSTFNQPSPLVLKNFGNEIIIPWGNNPQRLIRLGYGQGMLRQASYSQICSVSLWMSLQMEWSDHTARLSYRNSMVRYAARVNFDVACNMHFRAFPGDSQGNKLMLLDRHTASSPESHCVLFRFTFNWSRISWLVHFLLKNNPKLYTWEMRKLTRAYWTLAQVCEIKFESFAYTTNQLVFKWVSFRYKVAFAWSHQEFFLHTSPAGWTTPTWTRTSASHSLTFTSSSTITRVTEQTITSSRILASSSPWCCVENWGMVPQYFVHSAVL